MTGRVILKTWFLTGLKPTQAQFAEVFNSYFNLNDDEITIDMVSGLQDLIDTIQGTLTGISLGAIPMPLANATAVELAKADLNAAYPAALNGQQILCATINIKYIKLDNSPTGNWDMQPYNPVP